MPWSLEAAWRPRCEGGPLGRVSSPAQPSLQRAYPRVASGQRHPGAGSGSAQLPWVEYPRSCRFLFDEPHAVTVGTLGPCFHTFVQLNCCTRTQKEEVVEVVRAEGAWDGEAAPWGCKR